MDRLNPPGLPSSSLVLDLLNVINRSINNQCFNLTSNSHSSSSSSSSSSSFFSSSSTSSFYVRQRIVIDVFVVSLLCLFGFIGNALTVVVLSRSRGKVTSTDWLLQTLAVVDTVYLVSCLFVQTLKAVNDLTDWLPALSQHYPYVELYFWPVASIAQTLTIWTVLLVTADRYAAVCKPFSAHLRTRTRVKVLVASIVVAAVVFNVPHFFEREIKYETNPCSGEVTAKVTTTALRKSGVYFVAYKIVCYLIFRSVGPLVTLLVLNVLLIQALRRNRRKHQQRGGGGGGGGGAKINAASASAASAVVSTTCSSSNGRLKNRENITLMLIVVVSAFIVCQVPDVCLRLVINHALFAPTFDGGGFYRYVNAVTNVMLTLNSSVNFLIYCLIGRKFRRIFVQTFVPCCAAKGDGGGGEGTAAVEMSVSHPATEAAAMRPCSRDQTVVVPVTIDARIEVEDDDA